MKNLWERVLGTPPPDMQFALWLEYGEEATRYGILQTAAKNLKLNSSMNLDRKVRFASSVIKSYTGDPRANNVNTPRLKAGA